MPFNADGEYAGDSFKMSRLLTDPLRTPIALYLDHPADDTFTKELDALPHTINLVVSDDGLYYLFDQNRFYGDDVLVDTITEHVKRLKLRQSYQPPVHAPHWKLDDNPRGSVPAFFLYLFPFNQEVIEHLEANPALTNVIVRNMEEGAVNIVLHPNYTRDEIRPQIEEVLNLFATEKE